MRQLPTQTDLSNCTRPGRFRRATPACARPGALRGSLLPGHDNVRLPWRAARPARPGAAHLLGHGTALGNGGGLPMMKQMQASPAPF